MQGVFDNDCVFIECNGYSDNIIATATTVDGVTVVNLAAISLAADTAANINTSIIATRTGGTAGNFGETWTYDITTRAKNIGGAVNVELPIIKAIRDTVIPVVRYDAGTNQVNINIIGEADKTIRWVSETRVLRGNFS